MTLARTLDCCRCYSRNKKCSLTRRLDRASVLGQPVIAHIHAFIAFTAFINSIIFNHSITDASKDCGPKCMHREKEKGLNVPPLSTALLAVHRVRTDLRDILKQRLLREGE
ncbi:hypothetical protein KP509_22G018100 [Ceratopteris richardii]|uniref:Uncharacterized protein n=1 Tax=Ceratopteris richardii TaxID=49495 RepID=A0A8T2S315_CERRI|nr:hypothetical protein KP509_22G018100 [Ceratopteris richardii]